MKDGIKHGQMYFKTQNKYKQNNIMGTNMYITLIPEKENKRE